jgi:ketosteroid isomerase-like protein
MNMLKTSEIVEQLRHALEARNYSGFVDMFADDAVFEVPFGLQENQKRLEGIDAIRAHFNIIAQNPSTKLLELYKVNATQHPGNDPDMVMVEFRIQGKSVSTGKLFDMPSSIAIIHCYRGKVKHYKDFPNSIGYAQIANVLPQFANSLTNNK